MQMTDSSFIKDTISKMNIPYIGSISFDHDLEESIGNGKLLLKTKFMKELDTTVIKMNL